MLFRSPELRKHIPTLLKTFLGLCFVGVAQLAILSSNPGILGVGTAQALGFNFSNQFFIQGLGFQFKMQCLNTMHLKFIRLAIPQYSNKCIVNHATKGGGSLRCLKEHKLKKLERKTWSPWQQNYKKKTEMCG